MKIVFMGTPDFAAHVLKKLIDENHDLALVVSQPDRPVGRKKQLFPTPVKKVAMQHHIPVFQPEKIKGDYQVILDCKPDIIITAAYGQIIPKALLGAPRLGCINVHASLLPKYRGGAPIHQAIIDGETQTGVTIMYMDETMDTGDIISQANIPIHITDDVGTLFEKLSHLGAQTLIDTLPQIKAGTNKRIQQDHQKATYAYNIKRENELIDWTRSAKEIYNQIRGLNPWPAAYSVLNDVNVKIFKSDLVNTKVVDQPGTIIDVSNEGIFVVCGDGRMLCILELQVSGKKRMKLSDVLNGKHPFEKGTQFNEG